MAAPADRHRRGPSAAWTVSRESVDRAWHHPAVDDLVTPRGLRIDGDALSWTSVRSGGPGGQHANTSDTAVTVTLDLTAAGLSTTMRERLTSALGEVVTTRAADTRSQWRNRQLALERLAERLDAAARPPRPRRPTRPSRAAVDERLDDKRRRSEVKRTRQRPEPGD
jgi:ribosome-associated protein